MLEFLEGLHHVVCIMTDGVLWLVWVGFGLFLGVGITSIYNRRKFKKWEAKDPCVSTDYMYDREAVRRIQNYLDGMLELYTDGTFVPHTYIEDAPDETSFNPYKDRDKWQYVIYCPQTTDTLSDLLHLCSILNVQIDLHPKDFFDEKTGKRKELLYNEWMNLTDGVRPVHGKFKSTDPKVKSKYYLWSLCGGLF